MTFATEHDQEIFPVLDDHNEEDNDLRGCNRSNCRQSVCFCWTIFIDEPLPILHGKEGNEWNGDHRNRANENLILQLVQVWRVIPCRPLTSLFVYWNFVKGKQDSLHETWCAKTWLLLFIHIVWKNCINCFFQRHLPLLFLTILYRSFVRPLKLTYVTLNLLLTST